MQRILAICILTLRAAARYRLVLALGALLLSGVIFLPLIIKHDGTARGFTQIVLTYTMSLITITLGFSTIWLACGTLAREVEEAQIQMVAVKPIARWEIWLGKWMGIMSLNAILLVLSGIAIYSVMMFRARNLPEKEQAVLRNEVLVARAAAREPEPDYRGDAEKIFKERIQKQGLPEGVDSKALFNYVQEQVKASYQIVRPGYMREWTIDLGNASELTDKPLTVRTKFNSPDTQRGATYPGLWEIGVPNTAKLYRTNFIMVPEALTQFSVPPNLFDQEGVIHIRFINQSDRALLFPLDEGMEVLYRKGGFGPNFVRGLAIIFCWIAALAALGLAASSILSFPVAAFCTIGLLAVTFSTGTLKQIVDEGGVIAVNNNTGFADQPNIINKIAVPAAKGVLALLNLARSFSPIDNLSSGRLISWGELSRAIFQIIFLIGGILAAFGIFVFTRRELATAQGKT